ncbi:hypothetical protein SLA2020_378690 [Shorea laevis]
MATIHQPLLNSTKTPYRKPFCLTLSLVALITIGLMIIRPIDRPPPPLKICEGAHDQESCSAMISQLAPNTTIKTSDLLQLFLERSISEVKNTMRMANNVRDRINNPREQAALADCSQLMELSMDRIMDSMTALKNHDVHSHADSHSWLSTVLTNHVTCLDGLEGPTKTPMESTLNDLISRARTTLAIFVANSPKKPKLIQPLMDEFPSWVTSRDRRLLMSLAKDIKPDVVVAKDGSGKYKTLKEAVAAAPSKSKTRHVILVKKGIYKENVEIGSSKKNLMIVGDGMGATIITGSLNVVDGSTTFKSATVAAVGDGFIAQDIGFQNTAGPRKHQAVALRVGADRAVINRCKIDAYQDTLYAHTNRQFYRDSFITGRVDFIFGNAAAVFQNCTIEARKPLDNQSNMLTAQGREDPNQNTGTSIQKCEIKASTDLRPVESKIKTYLGRPWKAYSRTVVMQSNIGDHIDPTGWAPWHGDFALKTLYYGEYMNKGAGAGTSKRVKWAGHHVITNSKEAQKFTVRELIQGGDWLKSTGVTYTEGL